MDNAMSYIPTERRVVVGRKEILVRSLKPVFKDPAEYEQAKRKAQDGLYRVFEKYARK